MKLLINRKGGNFLFSKRFSINDCPWIDHFLNRVTWNLKSQALISCRTSQTNRQKPPISRFSTPNDTIHLLRKLQPFWQLFLDFLFIKNNNIMCLNHFLCIPFFVHFGTDFICFDTSECFGCFIRVSICQHRIICIADILNGFIDCFDDFADILF